MVINAKLGKLNAGPADSKQIDFTRARFFYRELAFLFAHTVVNIEKQMRVDGVHTLPSVRCCCVYMCNDGAVSDSGRLL